MDRDLSTRLPSAMLSTYTNPVPGAIGIADNRCAARLHRFRGFRGNPGDERRRSRHEARVACLSAAPMACPARGSTVPRQWRERRSLPARNDRKREGCRAVANSRCRTLVDLLKPRPDVRFDARMLLSGDLRLLGQMSGLCTSLVGTRFLAHLLRNTSGIMR
jgi:hypothetical protein